MGDIVTCKAVLKKSPDRTRADYLFLDIAPEDFCDIPCKPNGSCLGDTTENTKAWRYEEINGRLFIEPSLLVKGESPEFHTDYRWSVDYSICPEGVEPMAHFFAVNPGRYPDREKS